MKYLIPGLFVLLMASCSKSETNSGDAPITYYHEKYRPQFHFSPAKGWTNDPNGPVYFNGEYHLFFQYNPYGDTWGHMSWGHAVSKDLLHWEELPVALTEYPDPATGDSTMIFSGTVVIDKNNSSGLCQSNECMIAIYTSHVHKGGEGKTQHQSLAYSNDKGRTWKRYEKNPILDIQRKDFRDPKVFWYEPNKSWIMALVIPDLFKVQFYKSSNLKDWSLSGEFGNIGDTLRIWECPDIYQLPIDNESGKSKWVLSLSGSHPAGPKFVGMQYFVGEFDGATFKADDPRQKPLYVDYGKDFYAGIVFNNIPKEDGRTIMIGWANNWTYGNQIPTSPWRSAMSVPRELSLRKTAEGIQLAQRPVRELSMLRGKEITDFENIENNSMELEIEIEDDGSTGLSIVLKNDSATTYISYRANELSVDRTTSGDVSFNKEFASIETIKLKPIDNKIKLRVLIDQSIIEIFANDGEQSICEQYFPPSGKMKLKIAGGWTIYPPLSTNPTDNIDRLDNIKLKAWEIKSTWQ